MPSPFVGFFKVFKYLLQRYFLLPAYNYWEMFLLDGCFSGLMGVAGDYVELVPVKDSPLEPLLINDK